MCSDRLIDLLPIVNEFKEHGISTDRIIVGGDSDLLSKEAMAEITDICTEYEIELDYVPRLVGLSSLQAPVVQNQAEQKELSSHCFFAITLFPGKALRGFLPRFTADRCSVAGLSCDRRYSSFGCRFSDIFLATARRN